MIIEKFYRIILSKECGVRRENDHKIIWYSNVKWKINNIFLFYRHFVTIRVCTTLPLFLSSLHDTRPSNNANSNNNACQAGARACMTKANFSRFPAFPPLNQSKNAFVLQVCGEFQLQSEEALWRSNWKVKTDKVDYRNGHSRQETDRCRFCFQSLRSISPF